MPTINEDLYSRLGRCFGRVLVANAGESLRGYPDRYDVHDSFKIVHSGEYYRVCCPFCQYRGTADTSFHLWINHLWGVGPGQIFQSRDKFWRLAICYKGNCLDDPANFSSLRDMVYRHIGQSPYAAAPTAHVDYRPATLQKTTFDGRLLPVNELPPEALARRYLEQTRHFDVECLAKDYGVGLCVECYQPDQKFLEGRIIAPIYMHGQMVGWQARTVLDQVGSKYFLQPGFHKRLALYGYDQAQALPWVAVTEGITNVWKTGPGFVASFGKSLSTQQVDLIAKQWKYAVLFVEPDAREAARKSLDLLRMAKVRATAVDTSPYKDVADSPSSLVFDRLYTALDSLGFYTQSNGVLCGN